MELKLVSARQCAEAVFSTGMTSSEIARRVGASVSSISRLRKNLDRKYRCVDAMRKLARELMESDPVISGRRGR